MKPKSENRTRWLVEQGVQKAMLLRICVYWIAGILFVSLPIALFKNAAGSGQFFVQDVFSVWEDHWPILVCFTLMLPFVLNDLLRFSNRFSGPIFRLKRELQQFQETGKSVQISLREKDYWKDVVESFCELTQRIESLEKQIANQNREEESIVQMHSEGRSGN